MKASIVNPKEMNLREILKSLTCDDGIDYYVVDVENDTCTPLMDIGITTFACLVEGKFDDILLKVERS